MEHCRKNHAPTLKPAALGYRRRIVSFLPLFFCLLSAACQQSTAPVAVVAEAPAASVQPAPTAIAATMPPPDTPTPQLIATAAAMPTVPPAPTAVPTPLPLDNPTNEAMAAQAAGLGAAFVQMDSSNTGLWQYAENSFIHPLALLLVGETAVLLDSGRVLLLDLANPQSPTVLLAPGDRVDGVVVQEPLDAAVDETGLVVLDRVGDVYRYEWATAAWQLDRYDRPARDRSSHYLVALAAATNGRYLLETNYKYALRYQGEEESLWTLPETARNIDIDVAATAAADMAAYILSLPDGAPQAKLTRYRGGSEDRTFRPFIEMVQPRQVVATPTAVYVLDQDGRRLLQFDPASGALLTLFQLPQNDPATAFAVAGASGGDRLLLAGRNRLFFFQQPERRTAVAAAPLLPAVVLPNDPHWLAALPPLLMPIGGSDITSRDLQLPGAPRHYRLGIHAGLDFYWGAGTAVRAAASGTVIRATQDYTLPEPWLFDQWRNEAKALGYSSAGALDFYRGRQVWLAHDDGLVSRYVHLESIDPAVVEGARVERGQRLGTVGNSGSPASQFSVTDDAHLHFELWQGDYYLGEFLRPVEVREWFARLLVNE